MHSLPSHSLPAKLIMKIFPLTILFILLTFCSPAQSFRRPVGINENGSPKVTAAMEDLKSEWKELLTSNGIRSPLKEFYIRSAEIEGSKTYYYLLAETEDKMSRIAILLRKRREKFFLPKQNRNSPSTTVICSGCITGCDPRYSKDAWYCENDCDDTCTKITTLKF